MQLITILVYIFLIENYRTNQFAAIHRALARIFFIEDIAPTAVICIEEFAVADTVKVSGADGNIIIHSDKIPGIVNLQLVNMGMIIIS